MKEKINAAKVIKHMSEKELEHYDITLETKSKSYIPDWFKPFASMLEKQQNLIQTVLDRLDNIVKLNNLKE